MAALGRNLTLLRPDAAWAVFPGVVAFVGLLTVLALTRLLRQSPVAVHRRRLPGS